MQFLGFIYFAKLNMFVSLICSSRPVEFIILMLWCMKTKLIFTVEIDRKIGWLGVVCSILIEYWRTHIYNMQSKQKRRRRKRRICCGVWFPFHHLVIFTKAICCGVHNRVQITAECKEKYKNSMIYFWVWSSYVSLRTNFCWPSIWCQSLSVFTRSIRSVMKCSMKVWHI